MTENVPAAVMMDEPAKDYVTSAAFVVYDEFGNIEHTGQQGIAFTTDAMSKGERVLLANFTWNPFATDIVHFVDVAARKVREKTACPATLAGQTLNNLPTPCRIEISEPAEVGMSSSLYEWTDPICPLTFDHPGTYGVRVLSVPHLPGEFTVTVNG